jgi:hypothetical protein
MLAARANNAAGATTTSSSASSAFRRSPAPRPGSLAQRRALPAQVLSGLAAAGDVDAPIGVVIGGWVAF